MNVHLTQDFKTINELAKNTMAIVKNVRRTGQPVVVTMGGKPGVVIVAADDYEQKLHVKRLRSMLLEAEADIEAGRERPLEEFLEELNHAKKISGKNHRKR